MAGGALQSTNDKKRQAAIAAAKSGQEILTSGSQNKANTPALSPDARPKLTLSGVLFGPGKSEAKPTEKKSFSGEFLPVQNIVKEQKVLFDLKEQAVKREIDQILGDIRSLIGQVKEIQSDIASAAINPPVETNQYQVNFLSRIRIMVQFLLKNIREAGEWSAQFSQKSKKKKNMFWNMAKDKKKGGQQYMESGEHSVSRSVN